MANAWKTLGEASDRGAALAYAATRAARLWRRADLRGQVALIVGGSRGLGLALARELAAAGCRLVIAARDEHELAEGPAFLRLTGFGGRC